MRLGEQKNCKICGRPFLLTTGYQRYCSEPCRKAGRRANSRASYSRTYVCKRKRNAARDREICGKYQMGKTIRTLAEEYFFTVQGIRYILKKGGALK
jgi:hypothetical protein